MSQRAQSSVEFVVRPRENLSLQGSIRTLPRVTKGEQYPCQMQKNQSFSCLFRHYAKHNGLTKEDLVFYFVDELRPDDTPESVHLMPYDEIWVEHRIRKKNIPIMPPKPIISQHLEKLFQCGEHHDITFVVGTDKKTKPAHKAILSARSEYFSAMFRNGGMTESSGTTVEIPNHSFNTFMRMLEFLYTECIKDIVSCTPMDFIELIMLANEYLLDDLKSLCEIHAANNLQDNNIGRMISICDKYGTSELRVACQEYIIENISTLRSNQEFRQEVADSPEVALLLVDVLPDLDCKRRKLNSSPDSESSSSSSSSLLPLNSPTDATHISNEQQSSIITSWPSTVMHSDHGW